MPLQKAKVIKVRFDIPKTGAQYGKGKKKNKIKTRPKTSQLNFAAKSFWFEDMDQIKL